MEIAYNSYYGEEALPIKNRLQTHKVTRKLDEDNVWRLEFFFWWTDEELFLLNGIAKMVILCENVWLYFMSVFPLTIFYHLYFLWISKVLSMLQHRSVGWVHSRECYFIIHKLSWHFFFFFFHQKICFFIIFNSFDEVSKFRNRIPINQKPEWVIRYCQCNFMLSRIHWILYISTLQEKVSNW